jgi:hypothetical protein
MSQRVYDVHSAWRVDRISDPRVHCDCCIDIALEQVHQRCPPRVKIQVLVCVRRTVDGLLVLIAMS